MPEIYLTALSYAPMVFFALVGSIFFALKKYTFNTGMTLIALAVVGKLVFHIALGGIFPFIIQTVIALLVFFLLILFFSSKTSGETILTMTSMFLLTPLLHGVWAFLATFVLLFLYSILFSKDRQELKASLFLAITSTGMAHALPNYEHLPDRKDLDQDAMKVSLMPFIAVAYGAFALYHLMSPLWMES